jgi:hypothetical protein
MIPISIEKENHHIRYRKGVEYYGFNCFQST